MDAYNCPSSFILIFAYGIYFRIMSFAVVLHAVILAGSVLVYSDIYVLGFILVSVLDLDIFARARSL